MSILYPIINIYHVYIKSVCLYFYLDGMGGWLEPSVKCNNWKIIQTLLRWSLTLSDIVRKCHMDTCCVMLLHSTYNSTAEAFVNTILFQSIITSTISTWQVLKHVLRGFLYTHLILTSIICCCKTDSNDAEHHESI